MMVEHTKGVSMQKVMALITVAVLFSPTRSWGHPFTVDQANDIVLTRDGYIVGAGGPTGQEFTPTGESLDVVELQMNTQTSTAGTAFVRIRSGSITGPILGVSGSVDLFDQGGRFVLTHFDFLSPVPLTPGGIHVIEVVHADGGTLGVFSSGFGNDFYPGGTAISMGELQSFVDLWFREGPVSGCELDVELTFAGRTLTMDFVLRTSEPVIWTTWLIVGGAAVQLWSIPLPAIPNTPVSLPFPGFPDLGLVGVLTTFSTAAGTVCGDFAIVDCGSP